MGVKKLKTNQKGFTLIELLVVIAIIGLLASVVLLALNSARQKSRDAKRLADARQVASAMELYFNDNSSYPASLGALVATYMGTIPSYPGPMEGSCSSASSGTQNAYTQGSGGATYSFTFCLSATTGGLAGGTRTLTQAGIQ